MQAVMSLVLQLCISETHDPRVMSRVICCSRVTRAAAVLRQRPCCACHVSGLFAVAVLPVLRLCVDEAQDAHLDDLLDEAIREHAP